MTRRQRASDGVLVSGSKGHVSGARTIKAGTVPSNLFDVLSDTPEATQLYTRTPEETSEECEEATPPVHGHISPDVEMGVLDEDDGLWQTATPRKLHHRPSFGATLHSTRDSAIDVRRLNTWRKLEGESIVTDPSPRLAKGNARGRSPPKSTKFNHSTGPRTLGGIPLEKIKPGVIIWRLDYRPCTDPNVKVGDPGVFEGPSKEKLRRKGRYWVVVYRCRDHITVLPIYTFGGNGLSNKRSKTRESYNSIIPPDVDHTDFVNQSPNQMVLEIAYVETEDQVLKNTMVVRTNELMSHANDVVEARIVGQLAEESSKELFRRIVANIGTYTDD